jgi:CBS domain-containing protein
MLSNPAWRRAASDFASAVRHWLLRPEPEGLMALAIFLDAHAVAGDPSLLAAVRGEVDRLVSSNDALLGLFASAIDLFPDGGAGAWGNRLLAIGDQDRDTLDVKKAAIFPLVHGVRSLALEVHVADTGTLARLDALVAASLLPHDTATDLADALQFLIGIKLRAGLAELETGKPVSGGVRLDRLSSLERDLLKDALAVVKRFRTVVRHRYHLDL